MLMLLLLNHGNIILNEESIDYKWCNIDEFIKLIEWDGDKKELQNVVERALNKEIYFKNIKIN